MDDIKQAASKAASAVDDAISEASKAARQGVAKSAAALDEAQNQGQELLKKSQGMLQVQLDLLSEKQEEGFALAKQGIAYCAANPYVAYPAATAAVLLLLPGTRSLLYRATIGRLRNPEAVVRQAQQRLEALGTQTEEFATQAQKLQATALAAEEEWQRGYANLKAARAELQRLSSSVSRGERQAEAVLQDLRAFRTTSNAVELRAEAANKVAELKAQRREVERAVRRILNQDV